MKPTPIPRVLVRRRADQAPATVVRRVSEMLRAEGASVPLLAVRTDALRAAQLDHREGFLISLLDGATNLETLLDVCGMPAREVLALLDNLARRGIVTWRRP